MKKIELNVTGMHCKSCVIIIKDALIEHKGVNTAEVDLKKNKAVVTYDEKLTNESQLINIISKEGYEAKISK